ncbi:hypothetical protein Gohar_002837 [Gossypium harknessii]|uniref:Uncharacterized protein n=1 Tax=Gossypium harknessii TaxID=34285 RepID=A0A7J9HM51_9ROSI|nr:hypothetical protein [Gossypium harknessii]
MMEGNEWHGWLVNVHLVFIRFSNFDASYFDFPVVELNAGVYHDIIFLYSKHVRNYVISVTTTKDAG